MEFETRVTNEKDFKALKPFAIYASEITKVMVFDSIAFNKGIGLLNKYFKIDENSPVNKEDMKFFIDCDEKYKITLIAPSSYVAFCNGTNYTGSSSFIPFSSFREIYILLKYDLIKPTENFMKYFYPMSKDSLVKELRSINSRKEFRGNKAWTFKKYLESEIASGRIRIPFDNITIENSGLFNYNKPENVPIMNEIRGTIIDINYKTGKAQISTPVGIIEIEKHGWHPFYVGWKKDSEIRLMYKKMYGDGEYRKIIDPIVLPENIEINNPDEFFSNFFYISNRKYPTDVLNKMFYEYKIRNLIYERSQSNG